MQTQTTPIAQMRWGERENIRERVCERICEREREREFEIGV